LILIINPRSSRSRHNGHGIHDGHAMISRYVENGQHLQTHVAPHLHHAPVHGYEHTAVEEGAQERHGAGQEVEKRVREHVGVQGAQNETRQEQADEAGEHEQRQLALAHGVLRLTQHLPHVVQHGVAPGQAGNARIAAGLFVVLQTQLRVSYAAFQLTYFEPDPQEDDGVQDEYDAKVGQQRDQGHQGRRSGLVPLETVARPTAIVEATRRAGANISDENREQPVGHKQQHATHSDGKNAALGSGRQNEHGDAMHQQKDGEPDLDEAAPLLDGARRATKHVVGPEPHRLLGHQVERVEGLADQEADQQQIDGRAQRADKCH